VAAERANRLRRKREAEALQIGRIIKKREARQQNKDFLSSPQWLRARYKVLKRDGARCVCCGATAKDGVKIHVDHIKPRSKYPELALTLSNLQVLCAACNLGKAADDDTDWR